MHKETFLKTAIEYGLWNDRQKYHYVKIDNSIQMVMYDFDRKEWNLFQDIQYMEDGKNNYGRIFQDESIPDNWEYIEPAANPLNPLLVKARNLPWKHDQERFGDWILSMHHILTEPVCPTASVYPEDIEGVTRYYIHAAHPYQAIYGSLKLAVEDMLENKEHSGNHPITNPGIDDKFLVLRQKFLESKK